MRTLLTLCHRLLDKLAFFKSRNIFFLSNLMFILVVHYCFPIDRLIKKKNRKTRRKINHFDTISKLLLLAYLNEKKLMLNTLKYRLAALMDEPKRLN